MAEHLNVVERALLRDGLQGRAEARALLRRVVSEHDAMVAAVETLLRAPDARDARLGRAVRTLMGNPRRVSDAAFRIQLEWEVQDIEPSWVAWNRPATVPELAELHDLHAVGWPESWPEQAAPAPAPTPAPDPDPAEPTPTAAPTATATFSNAPPWWSLLPESACAEGLRWCRSQPSYEAAWRACPDGSWMIWLAHRLNAWPSIFEGKRVLPRGVDQQSWEKYLQASSAAFDEFMRDDGPFAESERRYQLAEANAIRELMPEPPALPGLAELQVKDLGRLRRRRAEMFAVPPMTIEPGSTATDALRAELEHQRAVDVERARELMSHAMTPHWSERLAALGACGAAVRWCSTQPDYETAWRECPDGRWMVWLLFLREVWRFDDANHREYGRRVRIVLRDRDARGGFLSSSYGREIAMVVLALAPVPPSLDGEVHGA